MGDVYKVNCQTCHQGMSKGAETNIDWVGTSMGGAIGTLAVLILYSTNRLEIWHLYVIGIVAGTYSSIYISASVALDLGLKAEHVFPVVRSKEVDSLP